MVDTDITANVAIITDDPGWHGRQLQEALSTYGFRSRYVSTMDCQINISEAGSQIHLPDFEQTPLAVFVRGVPGGTLEQVVFRLNVLHALSGMGVLVYNNPRGIERTVDKAMTSFLLTQAGIPTPQTWVCESEDKAKHIYEQECRRGKKLVAKPLFGSQGVGVHLLDDKSGLVHDETFAGVYYLQTFINSGEGDCSDIRVFVVNGKAISAMTRKSQSWITNRAQGAECESMPLDSNISKLAESAVHAVGIEYGGVDLMVDTEGRLQVIEVNSIPAWWGLQKVSQQNIAACLIDDLVSRLDEQKQEEIISKELNC